MPSITRLDVLAGRFREVREKLNARMNELHERHDTVMARGDNVATDFEAAIKQADAEITAMEGELRQLSNFPPDADGDKK